MIDWIKSFWKIQEHHTYKFSYIQFIFSNFQTPGNVMYCNFFWSHLNVAKTYHPRNHQFVYILIFPKLLTYVKEYWQIYSFLCLRYLSFQRLEKPLPSLIPQESIHSEKMSWLCWLTQQGNVNTFPEDFGWGTSALHDFRVI